MSFSINGKTAIVTGAANGVGLAIARHFIKKGAKVMMADRDEAKLRAELDDITSESGEAGVFPCDMREKLAQANLLSATIDAFERVDILVNASRQVLTTDLLSADDASVDALFQQNVLSGYKFTRLIAQRMIKQAEDGDPETEAGCVVNLSSIASQHSRPGLIGYSVASAALNQMTRTLAIALAPERIRVNAVSFGSVMSASLQQSLKTTKGLREDIIAHTPLGRIAPATEVAEVAQFLCSPAASFITGEVMVVDGGRSLLDPVKTAAH